MLSRLIASVLVAGALAGCGMFGGPAKPQPAELGPNPALIGVRTAWTQRLSVVSFPLAVGVTGEAVAVAGSDGSVALLDAASGQVRWRASAGAPVTAGVGTDGQLAAVVTDANELVAVAVNGPLWRQKLSAQGFTAPLVAGGRVFVLAADRSVSAFDAGNGRRLWSQTRQGDPLVLRQAGVLLAVGDTLVLGQGGRLVGMDPNTGNIRWEAPVASPRGVNDVERLVDLVERASRVGNSVCVRAFQASVGCVDASRGVVQWTQRANGATGLAGDERLVVGAEADGRVIAWQRDSGQRAWTSERLLHRGLGAPLLLGRSVIAGDASGLVHLLSREDGSVLNRLTTDGSPLAAPPVMAANTLVLVTRSGGVFGFVPN